MKRQKFKDEEDQAICEYIIDAEDYSQTGSKSLFKEMAAAELVRDGIGKA